MINDPIPSKGLRVPWEPGRILNQRQHVEALPGLRLGASDSHPIRGPVQASRSQAIGTSKNRHTTSQGGCRRGRSDSGASDFQPMRDPGRSRRSKHCPPKRAARRPCQGRILGWRSEINSATAQSAELSPLHTPKQCLAKISFSYTRALEGFGSESFKPRSESLK